MRDDELDFESIQRIFAKRDAEKQTKKEEIPTYELVGTKKPVQHKKTEMRSEPKYDNMRAKNIKITPKGRKHAQNNNLKLIVGVALVVVIGVASYNALKPAEVPEQPNSAIIYMDETYSQNEQDVLTLQECDFSNMTVILRESTSNTAGVVSVANRELTEMGADTRTISSDDDMISLISNIKKEDSDREIIVINLDGASNKGSDDAVIMTNYSNSAKSADVLAMGIFNANEDKTSISLMTLDTFCNLVIYFFTLFLISINNSYSKLIIFSSALNIKSSFSFNKGVINLSQLASVCFLIYRSGTLSLKELVTSM